ncbi:hypothetical protein ACFLTP_04475 [Chloroflexota bacterium]
MKKLFFALITAVLLLSMSGVATLAAPPEDHPGKGPPDLAKKVFVHYPKDLGAKGGVPGKPDKPPKPDDGDGGGKQWYKYSGIHWATPTATYLYNSVGQPGDYSSTIQLGFDTWEKVDGTNFDFVFGGPTGIGISSLDDNADGSNVVGWADLDFYGFTNAIAVTMVWYKTQTGLIVEIDMAFSNNTEYTWHNNTTGENWTVVNTAAYDVDVQNIATHEAGHWLMLGDMYNKPAEKETMYGISAEFDLAKRSLESGDFAGILEIYPAS